MSGVFGISYQVEQWVLRYKDGQKVQLVFNRGANIAGGAPSGGAGGVLSGTYPNPGFAVDMVEQTELATALAGKLGTGHATDVATHADIRARLPITAVRSLHVITSAEYPIAEVNPADDLAGWVAGGGREAWGVPTSGVSDLFIHDELVRTLSGMWRYNADAGTIVRHPDYATTTSLHDRIVFTTTNRDRSTGAVAANPDYRPIPTWIRAADPTDPIGTAEWYCVELIDTETFNTITGSLLATLTGVTPAIYGAIGSPLVLAADEIDGTGTVIRLLTPRPGASEGGYVPDGWITNAIGETPMAGLAALLGGAFGPAADAGNTNTVIIPAGPNCGVYRPTPTTITNGDPWSEVQVDVQPGTFAGYDFSNLADVYGAVWVGRRTATRFATLVPTVADLDKNEGDVLTVVDGAPTWQAP